MQREKIKAIVLRQKNMLIERFYNFNDFLSTISMNEINHMNDSDAIIHFEHAKKNLDMFLEMYNISIREASWKCFSFDSKHRKKLTLKKSTEKEFLFYECNTGYILCTNNELLNYLTLKKGLPQSAFLGDTLYIEGFIAKIDLLCDRLSIEVSNDVIYNIEQELYNQCFEL